MVKKKIGLAGRSGTGKDWIADYIGNRWNYRKIAVADAIRDEFAIFLKTSLQTEAFVCELPESICTDGIDAMCQMIWEKPTPSGIRIMLQLWGTEYRRSQDSEYWIKLLKDRLVETDLTVVSDVRLPIEMDAIKDVGGEVWLVNRPGVGTVGIGNHATEHGLDGCEFDRVIVNDGTHDDLQAKIEWIFGEC